MLFLIVFVKKKKRKTTWWLITLNKSGLKHFENEPRGKLYITQIQIILVFGEL